MAPEFVREHTIEIAMDLNEAIPLRLDAHPPTPPSPPPYIYCLGTARFPAIG